MAHEFLNAGITLGYCVSADTTRPTTGYTVIPGVKSLPSLSGSTNNVQVTDLADIDSHRYIAGLRDAGGNVDIVCNLTKDLLIAWDTFMAAQSAALEDENPRSIWWEIKIPNFKSYYFAGTSKPIGFNGAEVDSVAEATITISLNEDHGWDTAST